MKRANNSEQHGRGDFMDGMLKHRGEKDEIIDDELETNSEVLIVAGSETMATLLSGVTYWLLQNPDTMKKVTSEVRQSFEREEQLNFVNVAKLPYLIACLDEAMRIYPPVPTGLRRITLEPTTEISGVQVPKGCYVSIHQSAAYRSSRNFHEPMKFAPERWLPEAPEEFANDNKAVFQVRTGEQKHFHLGLSLEDFLAPIQNSSE
jgi:cytochrome P450